LRWSDQQDVEKSTSFVLARSKPQRTATVRLGFSLTAAALDGLLNILHRFCEPQRTAHGQRACLGKLVAGG
jgi:hypothetical protein